MSATLWVEITVRTGGWTWDKLEFLYYFVHMRCPHGRSGQNGMAPLDIVSRSRPTSFLVFLYAGFAFHLDNYKFRRV